MTTGGALGVPLYQHRVGKYNTAARFGNFFGNFGRIYFSQFANGAIMFDYWSSLFFIGSKTFPKGL